MLGNYENQYPVELHLYNNIFYNDNAQMGGTLAFFPRLVTLHAGHNLYYNPFREEEVICADNLGQDACFGKQAINSGIWNSGSLQSEQSLYADPAFVSPASGDFRLTAESPAVRLPNRCGSGDLLGEAEPGFEFDQHLGRTSLSPAREAGRLYVPPARSAQYSPAIARHSVLLHR